MPVEQLGVGPISISIFGFFVALGFLIASFLFWRKLREDYIEEEIISFSMLAVFSSILGARSLYFLSHFDDLLLSLGNFFLITRYPGFSLVGAFFSLILLAYYWCEKKKWNFWLVTDFLIQPLLVVFLSGSIGFLLISFQELPLWGESNVLIKFVLGLLVFVFSVYVGKKYRRFIWYKSGKPGFVTCTGTIVFFLGIGVLDFLARHDLYLDLVLEFLAVFLFAGLLYKRSDRVVKEDLNDLLGVFKNRLAKSEK